MRHGKSSMTAKRSLHVNGDRRSPATALAVPTDVMSLS
jgi:hypothetical protein